MKVLNDEISRRHRWLAGARRDLSAVLHVGVSGFAGGFVGVDIFFVISGYLICGMIDADIRSGSFSIGNFYKRRTYGSCPRCSSCSWSRASSLISTACRSNSKTIRKSLASAVGSVSNVYFAATAGYFDAPAETKPLLHTWSLAVEEQFYLITPLLMLCAYRVLSKRIRLLFAIVTVLSFAAAFAISFRNTTFVFYLTPFRAWELTLGALLSIRFIPAPRTEFGKNACGTTGLLLLLGVVVFGSSSAPLLLMTSLAAIGAARSSLPANRALRGRTIAVVAADRFHRPDILFALFMALAADRLSANGRIIFSRLLQRRDQTDADRGLGRHRLPVMEICRNALPIEGQGQLQARRFWRCLDRDGLGRGTLWFRADRRRGAVPLSRARGGNRRYLAYDPSAAFRSGHCYLATNRQQLDVQTCLKLDGKRPNYLLVGDSHAAHLWFGLSSAMPQVNIMQATASACRPAVQPARARHPGLSQIDEVRLRRFSRAQQGRQDPSLRSWKDEDIPVLSGTLDTLRSRGFDVTVLGPIVEYDAALAAASGRGNVRNSPSIASDTRTPGSGSAIGR